MNVGLIHYSYPPTVGGVEFILQGQARQFAHHGHRVRVISRTPGLREKNIRPLRVPELEPTHPENRQVCRELLLGEVTTRFETYQKRLKQTLRSLVRGLDLVLVHNVMTMHFNMALTAALWELAIETHQQTRWVFWTHDLCLLNPDYPPMDTRRFPHSLLRKRHPTAWYVAVSELRRTQMTKLLKIPRARIRVIPDAIDVPALLDLDPNVWNFFVRNKLAGQDIVLFFPTRVLPRKNLESAVELIAAIKKKRKKVTLLMTGAPDPHNPAAVGYFRRIRALIRKRNLEDHVIFVGRHFPVGFRQLLSLYRLCDAVLMTSRQEGFGLPLIEGGVHCKPVICPRREPFTEVMGGRAIDVHNTPAIIRFLDRDPVTGHFKRVLRQYSWERVWERHLSKL